MARILRRSCVRRPPGRFQAHASTGRGTRICPAATRKNPVFRNLQKLSCKIAGPTADGEIALRLSPCFVVACVSRLSFAPTPKRPIFALKKRPDSGLSAEPIFGRSISARRSLSGFVVIPGLCAMGCTSPYLTTMHLSGATLTANPHPDVEHFSVRNSGFPVTPGISLKDDTARFPSRRRLEFGRLSNTCPFILKLRILGGNSQHQTPRQLWAAAENRPANPHVIVAVGLCHPRKRPPALERLAGAIYPSEPIETVGGAA